MRTPTTLVPTSVGNVKEAAGRATNNPALTRKGQAEAVAGTVQKKVGRVEKVFGQ